jgi:hypothetical protein
MSATQAPPDLPVSVVSRRPRLRGDLRDGDPDVVGDGHPDRVAQRPRPGGQPVPELVRPAAEVGPDQGPYVSGTDASRTKHALLSAALCLASRAGTFPVAARREAPVGEDALVLGLLRLAAETLLAHPETLPPAPTIWLKPGPMIWPAPSVGPTDPPSQVPLDRGNQHPAISPRRPVCRLPQSPATPLLKSCLNCWRKTRQPLPVEIPPSASLRSRLLSGRRKGDLEVPRTPRQKTYPYRYGR